MRIPKWQQNLVAAGLLASTVFVGAPAFAEGDAEAGKKVFKKCLACHRIGEEAKNKTGPVLNNVIGRTAGTFEGFKYGKSIKAAGEAGLVWNPELIFDYLAGPKKFLRAYLDDPKAKSKMTFKLGKEQQRLDVIAYVSQFSEPPAAEAEEATESTEEGESTTSSD